MLSGEYLMSLRIDREISLREMEIKTKISYIDITEIEKGKITPTKEQLKEIFKELKISEEEKKKFYILRNQEKNGMKNKHFKYKNLEKLIKKLPFIGKVIFWLMNISAAIVLTYIFYETKSVSLVIYFIYFLFILNMTFFLLKKTVKEETKQISYEDEKEFKEIGDKEEYRELQRKKEKIIDKMGNYVFAVLSSGIFIDSKIFIKLSKENSIIQVILFFTIIILGRTGFDFYMNDIDISEKKLGLKNKFRNIPFISSVRIFGYQAFTFFIIIIVGINFMKIIEKDKTIEKRGKRNELIIETKEKKLIEELNSLDDNGKEKVLKFINDYIKN